MGALSWSGSPRRAAPSSTRRGRGFAATPRRSKRGSAARRRL